MAIKIKQKGEAELYGMAGQLIGRAKKAEKEAERLSALQRQIIGYQHQKEMDEFNRELELERRKYHSMMSLEQEKRATEWELEKMEAASRLDFARSEAKRQEKLDNYDAIIKKIDESDYLTEKTREDLKFKAYMKLKGYDVPVSMLEEEKERGLTPYQEITARQKGLEFLEEYEEKQKWWRKPFQKVGLAEEVTPEEEAMAEMYKNLLSGKSPTGADFTPSPQVPKGTYSLGQIINRGGADYRVVGFDSDGMPLVEKI